MHADADRFVAQFVQFAEEVLALPGQGRAGLVVAEIVPNGPDLARHAVGMHGDRDGLGMQGGGGEEQEEGRGFHRQRGGSAEQHAHTWPNFEGERRDAAARNNGRAIRSHSVSEASKMSSLAKLAKAPPSSPLGMGRMACHPKPLSQRSE